MAERALVHESLSDLRESLAGTVIAPDDARATTRLGAASTRSSTAGPAVIVRCIGAAATSRRPSTSRASRELEVAVRGGGHNPAGHCVCDGGLVIDLSLMRRVEVDREARIGRAEGGATWLDFDTRHAGASASSPPEASSARPAWAASPWAAGSDTSPPSTA